MNSFYDSHAHLTLLKQASPEEVLKRAREQGVSKMVTVSTDEASWKSNQDFADKTDGVYFSLGLHPNDSKDWNHCSGILESFFQNNTPPKKCVGIGETGLDFHYDSSTREEQFYAFKEQILLAKRVNLPLIIHCRDAFVDLYDTLKQLGMGKRTGVMHCFTGNVEQARGALGLGLKISFSGIVTFKNAEPIREAAKFIPETEILVETDCPFLAPVPLRGKPNEPSYLPHTVAALATLRGVTMSQMAETTYQNAEELFGT